MVANRTQRQPPQQMPARPPTKAPLIIEHFGETWLRELIDSGYADYGTAIPEAGAYRASWASKRCDRSLQYAMAGVPASDETTVADYWVFWLGSMIHGGVNMSLRTMGDGWIPDIDFDMRSIGIAGSGHADLVRFVDEHDEPFEMIEHRRLADEAGEVKQDRLGFIEHEYHYATSTVDVGWLKEGQYVAGVMIPTHVAELKSVGGFVFKKAATTFQGPPEGPKYGAIIQGALAAWSLGVDKLVVVNLSKENVSPSLAKAYSTSPIGRFAAEWKYSVAEIMPILEQEVGRIARVEAAINAGVLLPRMLHDPEVATGGIVTHPKTGVWRVVDEDGSVVASDTTWMCSYCSHQDQCIRDGAGTESVPVSF